MGGGCVGVMGSPTRGPDGKVWHAGAGKVSRPGDTPSLARMTSNSPGDKVTNRSSISPRSISPHPKPSGPEYGLHCTNGGKGSLKNFRANTTDLSMRQGMWSVEGDVGSGEEG